MPEYRVVEPKRDWFQGGESQEKAILLDEEKGGVVETEIGEILTYIKGEKYPRKGYPYPRDVKAVSIIKRGLVLLANIAAISPLKYLLLLMIFLPDRILLDLATCFLRYAGKVLAIQGTGWLKSEHFCKSGKEIWRAGIKSLRGIINGRDVLERALLLFCEAWEYETAYRYRGQDGLGELKKDRIKENLPKEAERILLLMADREIPPDSYVAKRWRALAKAIKCVLIIKGDWRRWLQKFLLELKISEVKLDEGDLYHCVEKQREDTPQHYKFNHN